MPRLRRQTHAILEAGFREAEKAIELQRNKSAEGQHVQKRPKHLPHEAGEGQGGEERRGAYDERRRDVGRRSGNGELLCGRMGSLLPLLHQAPVKNINLLGKYMLQDNSR